MIERKSNESLEEYFNRLRELSDREDIVMFVNACFAATRQNEFYRDSRQQAVSIDFLHSYILVNYRRIYAQSLSVGINHFNQQLIIQKLLKSGAPSDLDQRAEEGRLIEVALRRLPPNRVFRLFRELQRLRVNNRRTRAVISRYLRWRREPEFDAIKYRRKVSAAARHSHMSLPDDLGKFLFQFKTQKSFATPLLEKFRAAYYGAGAIYDLPFTIAEQFAQKHQIPRATFLQRIEPKLTANERLRLQRVADATKGANVEVDLSKTPPTKLAIYFFSLPLEERQQRLEEFDLAMKASIKRALSNIPFQLGRVAAVLDRSRSSIGTRQKRNRPLAVAVAASYLFRERANEYKPFWTLPNEAESELMVTPKGQTCLADQVIAALEWKPDVLAIVSDGYENDPPGATAQIVRLYRSRINSGDKPEIVHLNPVFDSDHYSPRPLFDPFRKRDEPILIPTVGLRDAEDIPTMFGFARFASGAANLDELETYLSTRSAAFCVERK